MCLRHFIKALTSQVHQTNSGHFGLCLCMLLEVKGTCTKLLISVCLVIACWGVDFHHYENGDPFETQYNCTGHRHSENLSITLKGAGGLQQPNDVVQEWIQFSAIKWNIQLHWYTFTCQVSQHNVKANVSNAIMHSQHGQHDTMRLYVLAAASQQQHND